MTHWQLEVNEALATHSLGKALATLPCLAQLNLAGCDIHQQGMVPRVLWMARCL